VAFQINLWIIFYLLSSTYKKVTSFVSGLSNKFGGLSNKKIAHFSFKIK